MTDQRPDWERVYRDCGGINAREAGELIAVTRETLRLAASALRAQNHADAYHNAMEAEQEINAALTAEEPQT